MHQLVLFGNENVVDYEKLTNTTSEIISNELYESLLPFDRNEGHNLINGKISNVWHSSIRRERLKHLSDYPICTCGAGDKINFIHDRCDINDEINVRNPTSDRKQRRKQKAEDKTLVKIPEKLVPEELILTTNFGVQPIKFLDELYSTNAVIHKKHKLAFPLLLPNNEKETKKILENFKELIQHIGFHKSDNNLPTSLHRFLDISKKEQDLYNTIFNSTIKEVTIDCIERGEILANIRQRYRTIFVEIPHKIKSYHDSIIAQRILDRRLMEELTKFQNTVAQLSSELIGVKQHEESIKQLCQQAREKLMEAVEDTKNNADLLREYYGLYELQRKRLEKSVKQIETERDCWKQATYRLTDQVLKYNNLEKGIQLMSNESEWYASSMYFVEEQLSCADNDNLSQVRNKTNHWQSEASKFVISITMRDETLSTVLDKEITRIRNIKEDLEEDYFNSKGQLIKVIDKTETIRVYNLFLSIEEALTELNDMFGGQKMLQEEDKLILMKKTCREYSDLAVEVFNRHRNEQDDSFFVEHDFLLYLNQLIEKMMNQLSDQLTGDNGVAGGISTVQNYLENWIARLSRCVPAEYVNATVMGSQQISNVTNFRPLPDSEWTRLRSILEDWIGLLEESRKSIGRVSCPVIGQANRVLELTEVIQMVDNWCQRSISGIESENTRLRESIINLQQSMIRWTAQIFLRVAPDYSKNSAEARRAARIASLGIKELHDQAKLIGGHLQRTSELITKSTKDIVSMNIVKKLEKQDKSSYGDTNKLQRVIETSKLWNSLSQELLKQMMDDEYLSQKSIFESSKSTQDESKATPDQQVQINQEDSTLNREDNTEEDVNVQDMIGNMLDTTLGLVNDEESLEEDVEEADKEDLKILNIPPAAKIVQGISSDSNVHSRYLIQDPNFAYQGNKFKNLENQLMDQYNIQLPKTNEAHKLIKIFEVLQTTLKTAIMDADKIEEENTRAELGLLKSRDTLSFFEDRYTKVNEELNNMKLEKSHELNKPSLLSVTNTLDSVDSPTLNRSRASSNTSVRKRVPPAKQQRKSKK